jgi:hypothetical protein
VLAAATGESREPLSPITEQVGNRMITVSFALLLGLGLRNLFQRKIKWFYQIFLSKKLYF